jgi:hypothetical protein
VADKPIKDVVSRPELVPRGVPAGLKQALLEVLYTMRIDRSTLFPDRDGLCARINWETKNRIERDFPPVSGARIVYLEVMLGAKGGLSRVNLSVSSNPSPANSTLPESA